MAQVPQKMSYQAVLRNSSNSLITQTVVGMKISILQGSEVGTPVYVETQEPTTNINGLASLEIGTGEAVSGTFSTIDWATGPYFIKTETDPTGGSNYSITGTSQLLSVPYALFSANGTPGPTGEPGAAGATGPNGLSAYQIWLSLGNTGTETQFITSLTGPQGTKGDQGEQGPQGEHAPCNGAPTAPAIIYGSVCKGAKSTLSIDPVPGATSYQWGCSDGQCLGSGTYFSFELGSKQTATYVFVKAVNACGSSGETRIYLNQTHGIVKYTPATTGTKASTFVVPCGVTSLQIEMAGAAGGSGFVETLQAAGGKGAYLKGTLTVNPGQIFVFNAGAKGGNATFNGGGIGGKGGNIIIQKSGINGDNNGGDGAGDGTTLFFYPICSSPGWGSGGGGGAGSDIRTTALTSTYDFNNFYKNATFDDIVLAAGGGGGGGSAYYYSAGSQSVDGNTGGNGGFLTSTDQKPTGGIDEGRESTNASISFGGGSNNASGSNGTIGNVTGRNCDNTNISIPAGGGGGGGGGGGSGKKNVGGGGGTGLQNTPKFTLETRTAGANDGDGYIIVRW